MIHITNIDIYRTSILFFVGIDENELDAFYEENKHRMDYDVYKGLREDIVNEDSCNGCTCAANKAKDVVVFIRKGQEYVDCVVIHEIYHAINRVLMERGVNHDIDDEPFAYLLGYVTNDYFLALEDAKKEKETP